VASVIVDSVSLRLKKKKEIKDSVIWLLAVEISK
jgi:hypothetical protein